MMYLFKLLWYPSLKLFAFLVKTSKVFSDFPIVQIHDPKHFPAKLGTNVIEDVKRVKVSWNLKSDFQFIKDYLQFTTLQSKYLAKEILQYQVCRS